MAEYIEREVAIQYLKKHKPLFDPKARPVFDVTRHLVSQVPAADVVPVVHGRWKCNYWDNYECSICGVQHNLYVGRTKYCHNCGARMDGE